MKKEIDEQAERIRENMKWIDWENDSLHEIEDVFEDRDPVEFL
jgi:hypothetical protein